MEDAQRAAAKDRKLTSTQHVPEYFILNPETGQYEYLHSDLRPWDPLNDLFEYEKDFIVRTKTRHKTPMIRTQSIVSVNGAPGVEPADATAVDAPIRPPKGKTGHKKASSEQQRVIDKLEEMLRPIVESQKLTQDKLNRLQHDLHLMAYQQKERDSNSNLNRDMVLLVVLIVMIQAPSITC